MARKGETGLQRRIQRALKKEFKLFIMKIHGNEFQRAGFPDLLICCAGLFFALEVKMPKGKISEVQTEVMHEIRKAGGFVKVVEDPDTAVCFMRKVLAREKKLLGVTKTPTARGRRIRSNAPSIRALLQAAPRKDVHRRGRH